MFPPRLKDKLEKHKIVPLSSDSVYVCVCACACSLVISEDRQQWAYKAAFTDTRPQEKTPQHRTASTVLAARLRTSSYLGGGLQVVLNHVYIPARHSSSQSFPREEANIHWMWLAALVNKHWDEFLLEFKYSISIYSTGRVNQVTILLPLCCAQSGLFPSAAALTARGREGGRERGWKRQTAFFSELWVWTRRILQVICPASCL